MRLIEKLLGKEGVAETKPATAPEKNTGMTLPRESVFSGPPTRILKTDSDVRKDDALLEMSQVVAEVGKNPDTNWQKYKGDFEKAVVGMRAAFEPELAPKHDQAEPPSGGSLRQQLTDSGWKLSSRDEHALLVYEQSCKEHSESPNPYDAGTFLKEFRGQDEESRDEQVEARRRGESIER
jgi:hypothetical protein